MKRNIDILLILALGFVLRFSVSMIHSYSNDELSAVTRLRFDNFSDLVEFGVKTGDMHPAGVQFFMKFWSYIAGTSEVGMRFPFVIFGTLSILVVFLIGKQWFNRKVGLYASGLLAVLYFPIMNSEFARPYSPGLLICLLVGFFIHKVLFDFDKKWRNAVILGLLFAAAMYTHYFAFLFVGFIGVSGLIFINKSNWKQLFLAGLIGLSLFLPHYQITEFHLNVGGLQWLPPPNSTWLLAFLSHAFNASWIVISLLIVMVALGVYFGRNEIPFQKRNIVLLIIWFFGIFVVGFIMSYISTPVLKFPVMLFAFPFFLLWIGLALSRLPKIQIILPLLLIVTTGSTLVERKLYGNQHYSLFKEVGEVIAGWNQEYGDSNIYTIYNLNNPSYMNFYAANWGGDNIHFDWWNIDFDSDIQIRRDLMSRSEEYCIIGYSGRVTTVQLFETVHEFYPSIIDYWNFENGSVFLMKKGESKGKVRAKEVLLATLTDGKAGSWESNPAYWSDDYNIGGIYTLDSSNIYGPTYSFKLSDLPDFADGYLKVYVQAHLNNAAGLTVSLSALNNEEFVQDPITGENMWIGYDLEEMILSSAVNMGYFAFKIPDYIKAEETLRISLWNRNGTAIQIERVDIFYIENIFNP